MARWMLFLPPGPSLALNAATAACSAASCSGLPPVPRPTNQRMRILPSDVMPLPAPVSAVTSGVGAADAAAVGALVGAFVAGAALHAARATVMATAANRPTVRSIAVLLLTR